MTIIEQVISALRATTIIRGNDLAEYLDIDPRELRAAWHLLTGTTLTAAIRQWRIQQARDLLAEAGFPWKDDGSWCKTPPEILEQVATQCGWRSGVVLKHVLRKAARI